MFFILIICYLTHELYQVIVINVWILASLSFLKKQNLNMVARSNGNVKCDSKLRVNFATFCNYCRPDGRRNNVLPGWHTRLLNIIILQQIGFDNDPGYVITQLTSVSRGWLTILQMQMLFQKVQSSHQPTILTGPCF